MDIYILGFQPEKKHDILYRLSNWNDMRYRMTVLHKMLNRSRLMFQWRYFRGQTPWDTNITPPEVMDFIHSNPAGKALDLGCGTGTNAITLARHGWKVTGVDFAEKAIQMARKKAAKAGFDIEFYAADVTDLSMLHGPYDYALDIGCLFTLTAKDRRKYADHLIRLVKQNGIFMLYAWLPRPRKGTTFGISPEDVEALMASGFKIIKSVIGEENHYPTAWYWFEKT